MKHKCNVCGKEFDTGSALGGHRGSHSEKMKAWNREWSTISTLKRIEVEKLCERCGDRFTVTRNVAKNGKEKISKHEKHFCKICSHKRPQTKETRQKIASSLLGSIPWNKGNSKGYPRFFCKVCGKEISLTNKSGFCKPCQMKTDAVRNEARNRLIQQYKNNRKVFGGRTKWYSYKNIRVQGTYELRTCFILDEMLKNGEIKRWEYTNDRIEYEDGNGESHLYLLDFKITDDSGTFYIETKGYTKEKDIYKWKRADELGITVKKWFLKDIKEQEQRLEI
jgi:DNA-directed RNA polymerase subunit RPC12/RpoP